MTKHGKVREELLRFRFVTEDERSKADPIAHQFYDRLVDELLKYLHTQFKF